MNILITGASKGLGRELALKFARQDSCKQFLLSRSEKLLKKLAKDCVAINSKAKINIIPYDFTRLIVENSDLDIDVPHLDIIINNAGLLINKKFSELIVDEIVDMTSVNFIAPVILLKNLSDRLGTKGITHVVNIGSMGGYQGSVKFPGLSIYSATKAAIASFTECMAHEYADTDVYVNCLALGAVQTEMLNEAFPGYKAPLSADEMAEFVYNFAVNGHKFFRGKILPVSVSTP
ncbi:MAG: SDR family NAD(P)-dependent oxidoreductase [Bacteroidales bacterium]|nr:SDR family NAD(P)-dependent oxidoreductase [Bacteroidales bacterium]